MEAEKTKYYKKDLIYSAISTISLMVFVFSTNPRNLSAVLLLMLPVLVMGTVYFWAKLSLAYFGFAKGSRNKRLKETAALIAATPTLMIVIGSTGKLGLQDVVLSLMLVSGFGWYVRRIQEASGRS